MPVDYQRTADWGRSLKNDEIYAVAAQSRTLVQSQSVGEEPVSFQGEAKLTDRAVQEKDLGKFRLVLAKHVASAFERVTVSVYAGRGLPFILHIHLSAKGSTEYPSTRLSVSGVDRTLVEGIFVQLRESLVGFVQRAEEAERQAAEEAERQAAESPVERSERKAPGAFKRWAFNPCVERMK